MSSFVIERLLPGGPHLVVRQPHGDARGAFVRLFCDEDLAAAGWAGPVRQANLSTTNRKGSLRGLHFQRSPHAEIKLVSCVRGSVWDVAVDIRVGSPTFLRYVARELSADNGAAMLIPPGFAHGFQTLQDDCELLYFHSQSHRPDAEDGLNPFDSRLAIPWPLEPTVVSNRDSARTTLSVDFEGVFP